MNYYDDVLQTIKTRRHVAYSTNILEPGVGLFSNRFSQISTVLLERLFPVHALGGSGSVTLLQAVDTEGLVQVRVR